MTILSGFDTHDPDYKTGHFICPRCGMTDVVDTMEIEPASDGLVQRYLDIKEHCGYDIPETGDLQMNICSNCGLMWIDNEGNYSTSQLISYLFTSFGEIVDLILTNSGSATDLIQTRKDLVASLHAFYMDNSLDFAEPGLTTLSWIPSTFSEFEVAKLFVWMNTILKGASPDDIVDIYNSWIENLGKYAKEFGCAPVSGKIDTAVTPYVDEVEKISTDNMEILNDE